MNNDELKQTLLEQKVPMNIAVAKKLAYLESDDVFSKDNPNYIGFSLKPMVKDDNGSVLKDAFLSLQATSVPKENINPPTMSINTYQKTQETSQRDFVETPSQSVQQFFEP